VFETVLPTTRLLFVLILKATKPWLPVRHLRSAGKLMFSKINSTLLFSILVTCGCELLISCNDADVKFAGVDHVLDNDIHSRSRSRILETNQVMQIIAYFFRRDRVPFQARFVIRVERTHNGLMQRKTLSSGVSSPTYLLMVAVKSSRSPMFNGGVSVGPFALSVKSIVGFQTGQVAESQFRLLRDWLDVIGTAETKSSTLSSKTD
jgi:hypothetical protein